MFKPASHLDGSEKLNSSDEMTATQINLGGSIHHPSLHPQDTEDYMKYFQIPASLDDISMPSNNINQDENINPVLKVADSFAEITSPSEEVDDTNLSAKNIKEYANFKNQKSYLSGMVKQTALITKELKMDRFTQKLKTISNKVENETFKIQIVGTFKNGKSTFINSFLGEEILPAYALPCTAVINEVKYGEEKRAVLHFKNPVPSSIPKELAPDSVKHMKKYNMENIPPMEIPYDEIEKYVVIPIGKNPKDMLLESPYEKIELFWPLEILKNGIEIIDSPGLNEHATRTKVTMDYISRADAVIFVLSATTLCTMEEMTFIETHLKARGFDDLFFIINRFDMIESKEKPRICKYACSKLSKLTNFGEEGLFFVSAKNALEAKKYSDKNKFLASGMSEFESYLSEYLTSYKGKLKLGSTSRKLRHLLSEDILTKFFPSRKVLLDSSLDELNEKYSIVAPKIKHIQERKDIVRRNVMYAISQTNTYFKDLIQKHLIAIISSVPRWVSEFIPVNKLGIFTNSAKEKLVTDEIMSYLLFQIEKSNSSWQANVLFPAMQQRADSILHAAGKDIQALVNETTYISSSLSGGDTTNSSAYPTDYNHSLFSSLMYENLRVTKASAANIADKSLLRILSYVNPSSLGGFVTTAVSIPKNSSESTSMTKLKTSIISAITVNLSSATYELVNAVANNISQSYYSIAEKMLESANDEIAQIQEQIESVIAEAKKGESMAKEKRDALLENENKIKQLCADLQKFEESVCISKKRWT